MSVMPEATLHAGPVAITERKPNPKSGFSTFLHRRSFVCGCKELEAFWESQAVLSTPNLSRIDKGHRGYSPKECEKLPLDLA